MYYRPLPNGLYIGLSKIEGQGVYTSKELLRGCKLGESHYRIDVSGVNSVNEEENENIIISPGEELTLKYEFYDPEKPI